MSKVRGKRHDLGDAISLLERQSIPVQEQAYGFSISHPELVGGAREFACCGCEHNYSISISLFTDELPPVVWFYRFDYREMAQFIADAYTACPYQSRVEIVAAMRAIDRNYDPDELESRIKTWCKAMSQQTGLDFHIP